MICCSAVLIRRTRAGRGRRVVVIGMDSRSPQTIDPRIPSMPGRVTSGVHLLLAPNAKRHEVVGESHGV